MTLHNVCTLTRPHTPARDLSVSPSQSLGSLLRRYPYLAQACRESSDVRQIDCCLFLHEWELVRQRAFDRQLVRYTLHEMRSGSMQWMSGDVQAVRNPTLLGKDELLRGLKVFIGKGGILGRIRDRARKFRIYVQQNLSYAEFQQALYCYLVDSSNDIQISNSLRMLWKKQCLSDPTTASLTLTPSLLDSAMQKVLDFFTISLGSKQQNLVFLDLLSNREPMLLAAFFLKLVLMFDRNDQRVQRQLMSVIKQYANYPHTEVQDIVRLLEYFNLALSVNLGEADVSYLFAR